MKRDDGELFKKSILEMAIKYEPLRYAVVGYAAYFHTLKRPDGHISHFLKYYNESVSRLRASITRSKKQGLSTFITILQLAAIEVGTSCLNSIALADCIPGSTRGLGQSDGPPEGGVRNPD